MTYIPVPIDTTPTDLAEEAFAYLEEQVPGWLPSPGNLEAWLVEALAQLAAELRVLLALVPDSIFAFYGESILNLAPYPATPAQGVTDWVAIDFLGYTVDAGTLVGIEPPASTDVYAFEVVQTFTIPSGSNSVTGIAIQAIEPGASASGLTGTAQILTSLDFIESVTLDGATSGGVDAETTDAYLSRLSDLLTLLSPRPILPQDFAVLAQRTVPEVARAVAIDLYNLSTGATNVPRCVTVVIVNDAGGPCSAAAKTAVDNLLQAQREVNFLVFVGDPTYTTVDVHFDATSYPGFDPAAVQAAAIAAVQAYLSPTSWGVPPYGDTSGRSWINDTTVRYLELAQVINDTEGVHYISNLTLNKAGSAAAKLDVVLPGVAPLPEAGAITATMTAET